MVGHSALVSRLVAIVAVVTIVGSACAADNVALDDTNDPIAVALADHLRAHGPVSRLLEDADVLSGVEAACTAGVFFAEHGELLTAAGVDEVADVEAWFDFPLPWSDELRDGFNSSLVDCLSESTLVRYDETMINALDVQGFRLSDDNVRCVTEVVLSDGLLSQVWLSPPATSLDFDLAIDRRADLTGAQRIWADALLTGFEGCLGLGGMVAEDMANMGLTLSSRTTVCIQASGSDISLTEGWQAGLTLNEMSDPVLPTLLSCLDEIEVGQLVSG